VYQSTSTRFITNIFIFIRDNLIVNITSNNSELSSSSSFSLCHTINIIIITPINLDDTTTANITPHHQQNSVTLLCRIADDPTETDFVEFDFTKQPIDGSYDRLVSLVSQELEFEIDHVEKLRRLPCIRIRNDRDVQRLKDNHMIEVRIKKTDEHV